MIKKAVVSLAVVALAAMVAVPAVAGGGGGGSKGSVAVRIKNVGSDPVAVNALSGSPTKRQLFQGARVVSSNGVTQFSVRSGDYAAVAADPDQPQVINKVRNFNTRNLKTIYLQAAQDTTAATLVGAPGGVKF